MSNQQSNSCYQYTEIKHELYGLIILIFIFLPILCGLYFYMIPKIEKTYFSTFDSNILFQNMTIIQYDYITQTEYNLSFTSEDLNNTIKIDTIEFGFIELEEECTNITFMNAYLYHNSTNSDLNLMMLRNKYMFRTFLYNNQNQNQFKMSYNYQLFSIQIQLSYQYNNITYSIRYLQFLNSISINYNIMNILITQFEYNIQSINQYSIISIILTSNNYISIFDFSFR